MGISENIVRSLDNYIEGKKVLEVACGDSEFSLNAAIYADEVLATDISLERIKRKELKMIPEGLHFEKMDAANLDIEEDSFNVAICYNALAHLKDSIEPVLSEMHRVTDNDGYLIFVSTWRMDKALMEDLKDTIIERDDLELYDDIDKGTYKALIVKNNGNV